jgi:DNA-binding transcriptional LysR family regulator
MRELPELLMTGQVDFIVTDAEVHRADIESARLGEEEYVMVVRRDEGPDDPARHVYLDHDPDDPITQQFLSRQSGKVPEYRRGFMDEIYAIIDGIVLGLGRAILSKHLAIKHPALEIQPGYKSMFVPVYLHYHKQPYYTQLHKRVVDELRTNCPRLLSGE